jgi:glycine hydroxymethyltransferase
LTTRGFKEQDLSEIADLINKVVNNINNEAVLKEVKAKVELLCRQHPLYEGVEFK